MAINPLNINLGTGPGAGNGDPVRTAFQKVQTKANEIAVKVNAIEVDTAASTTLLAEAQESLAATNDLIEVANMTVANVAANFDTLAAANSALGSIAEGVGVNINADGDYNGFYVKESGVLVKKSDGTVPSIQARTEGYDASGPYLVEAADQHGFVGFLVDTVLQKVRTQWLDLGALAIENTSFRISGDDDGLAIYDQHGFAAVKIPVGVDFSRHAEWGALNVEGGPIPTPRCTVFAHQGIRVTGAPANSLDAYAEAARAGFRHVEMDVMITSDGEYVLMHDESINATCKMASDYSDISGTVNVSSETLADLRSTYVLASPEPRFRRPIPTLTEFARLCASLGLHPVVELKAAAFDNTHVGNVVAILRRYLGDEGFSLTSFTTSLLDHARTLTAKTHLYYIHYPTISEGQIDSIATKLPTSINLATDTASIEDRFAYARSKGVGLAVWTVPPHRFNEFLRLGVDAIAADTIPPAMDRDQRVIWRTFSGSDFARFGYPSGALSDGVVTLAANEYLILTGPEIPVVPFGALYARFDVLGNYSITETGLGNVYQTANVTGDDYQTQVYSELFASKRPRLVIKANSGGCTIKDVAVAIAQF